MDSGGIYTKKVYEYSEEEEQSKSMDAGNNALDPNNSGDYGDGDSSKDKEDKVTISDDDWTFFQYVCKLTPKFIEAVVNLVHNTVYDL